MPLLSSVDFFSKSTFSKDSLRMLLRVCLATNLCSLLHYMCSVTTCIIFYIDLPKLIKKTILHCISYLIYMYFDTVIPGYIVLTL